MSPKLRSLSFVKTSLIKNYTMPVIVQPIIKDVKKLVSSFSSSITILISVQPLFMSMSNERPLMDMPILLHAYLTHWCMSYKSCANC